MNARAAVLLAEESAPQLVDVEVRAPVDAEVLVRIEAVGICHTDVSVAARWPARKLPMVLGHEGVGTVIEAGPAARVEVGRQVVLTFASCGQCPSCVAARPAYCEHSTTLNMRGDRADENSALRLDDAPVRGGFFGQSSFATHVLAGPSNAIPLPEPLDPALAAPLACSVQTGVGTILGATSAGAEDAVVVFGAGAVGLSAVMGARIAGCRAIVAVDPKPERRSLATELGATAVIDPTAGDVGPQLADLTGGGPTIAVDTTALPPVLVTALMALRACGTLAIVGLGAMNADLPVSVIMARGLRVRGVIEGDSDPHVFIPRLAELVRRGELPLETLVTRFALDDFGDAWTAAVTGTAIKAVVTMPR